MCNGGFGRCSLGRTRLGVVGAHPGAGASDATGTQMGHGNQGRFGLLAVCVGDSTMALDETGEHGGDATGEMHDLVRLGLGSQSQGGEKLDA